MIISTTLDFVNDAKIQIEPGEDLFVAGVWYRRFDRQYFAFLKEAANGVYRAQRDGLVDIKLWEETRDRFQNVKNLAQSLFGSSSLTDKLDESSFVIPGHRQFDSDGVTYQTPLISIVRIVIDEVASVYGRKLLPVLPTLRADFPFLATAVDSAEIELETAVKENDREKVLTFAYAFRCAWLVAIRSVRSQQVGEEGPVDFPALPSPKDPAIEAKARLVEEIQSALNLRMYNVNEAAEIRSKIVDGVRSTILTSKEANEFIQALSARTIVPSAPITSPPTQSNPTKTTTEKGSGEKPKAEPKQKKTAQPKRAKAFGALEVHPNSPGILREIQKSAETAQSVDADNFANRSQRTVPRSTFLRDQAEGSFEAKRDEAMKPAEEQTPDKPSNCASCGESLANPRLIVIGKGRVWRCGVCADRIEKRQAAEGQTDLFGKR